jgi:hypothetical protein
LIETLIGIICVLREATCCNAIAVHALSTPSEATAGQYKIIIIVVAIILGKGIGW